MPPSTYHVLHVGGWGVNLAPELVVQVQDELCVAVADGPLPPLLGLPPVALLVQIFVQDPLPAGGIWEHHHGGGSLEQQEQSRASHPGLRWMLHRCGDRDDFKLRMGKKKKKPGEVQQTELALGKQTNKIGPMHPTF